MITKRQLESFIEDACDDERCEECELYEICYGLLFIS